MSLCKVCNLSDWESTEFLSTLDQLNLSFGRQYKHRKHWEFVQGILGLKRLGCLTPDALALGVGAGHEHPIYYLANYIKRVHATDIYGGGEFAETAAPAEMLVHPGKFAPFPYRQDHLVTQYMDGCTLRYPDQCFDFAFSFSSIEHFGGHKAATQSVREMARVLRSGGIAVITTELILNNVAHPDFFRPKDLKQVIIKPSGLDLIEEMDFSIPQAMIENPLDLKTDISNRFPHIVLKLGPAVFTSVIMFLRK
jgi:SAM-dependent methyltransferase